MPTRMDGSPRRRARAKPEQTANSATAGSQHSAALPPVTLRLAGTPSLRDLSQDDQAMAALREACRILEQLKIDRERIDEHLASARRVDPVRQVTGESALDRACRETEELIRLVDEHLSETAERSLASGLRPTR